MAKTTGFSQLVCDRCGKTDFAADGTPTAQSWRELERVDQSGTKVTRYLCPDCYKSYRTLAAKQDSDFSDFMAMVEANNVDDQ